MPFTEDKSRWAFPCYLVLAFDSESRERLVKGPDSTVLIQTYLFRVEEGHCARVETVIAADYL